MKKNRIIASIIFLIISINLILPTLVLATESNTIENEEKINEKINLNKELEEPYESMENNDSINEHDEKNSSEELKEDNNDKNEEKEEYKENELKKENKFEDNNILEEQSENISIKSIEEESKVKYSSHVQSYGWEEEFSIYIEDNSNKVNAYKKNENYYMFVPKNINLQEMLIKYTGNIESIDNLEFDPDKKQITGDFQNEGTFTIRLTNGQTKNVVIMQSDVPAIFINLNSGITLKNVNDGSKDTKYGGIVNVTGCANDKDNILQSEIEFKGRGNTTWSMPKRGYQIKFNKKTNFLGIGNSKEKNGY